MASKPAQISFLSQRENHAKMTNFLKNLQNKPEPVRRLIMWFGVFFVMAVIFVFWLMTFPSQIPAAVNDTAALNIKSELPGILETLKEQYSGLEKLWQR